MRADAELKSQGDALNRARRIVGVPPATRERVVIATADAPHAPMESLMFLTLAIVPIVLWAAGFMAFHVAGGLIHMLLILALVSIVWHFVSGRNTARI